MTKAQLEQRVKELGEELSNSAKIEAGLRQVIDTLCLDGDEAETNLEDAKLRCARLSADNDTLKSRITELEGSEERLVTRVGQLEQDLKDALTMLDVTENANSVLRDTLLKTGKQRDELESTNRLLGKNLAETQAQLKEMEAKYEQLEHMHDDALSESRRAIGSLRNLINNMTRDMVDAICRYTP